MSRVKRGNVAKKRRAKIFKLAKGFKGAHNSLFRTAKQQVLKSLRYSYVGRKRKKRDFRRLWITRINAATHSQGMNYSTFISALKKDNIALNRKMLAQLASNDIKTFQTILETVKN